MGWGSGRVRPVAAFNALLLCKAVVDAPFLEEIAGFVAQFPENESEFGQIPGQGIRAIVSMTVFSTTSRSLSISKAASAVVPSATMPLAP